MSGGGPYSTAGDGGYDDGFDIGGCQSNVCDCIERSMAVLTEAVYAIRDELATRRDDACKDIDKCIDKIYEALKKKIEGPLYDCQKCQQMLASGMGGTIEYAVRCANQVCDECDTVCTLADPSSEGKCCKGCGKEPCCCDKGTCVPCGEEEKDTDKWVGWCYPNSQSIAVTKQGDPPPGIGWIAVSLADSEQAAAIEATANCKGEEQTPYPKPPDLPAIGQYSVGACQFSQYRGGHVPIGNPNAASMIARLGAESQARLASNDLGIGGLSVGNAGQMIYGFLRYFTGAEPYIAQSIIPEVSQAFGCNDPVFSNSIRVLSEFQYINRALGIDLSPFTMPWTYAANMKCPTKFLEPAPAMAAYLSHAIEYPDLQTLWRMHGYCDEGTAWAAQAGKSKPVPLQLSMMRRRKIISESQFHSGMREIGYLDGPTSENIHRLTEQLPTLTDITRLMVRDADDESIEFWPESDQIFKAKFGTKLKEWSESQGIPEEFAKMYFRAHWYIPSPTQLFTFWHRLRDNPDFGGRDKLWKQITDALVQQDILPFWHKHYQAVAYNPMGRIDIRRAFNIGAIEEKELVPLFNQIGYSDETSEKLKEFTIRLRDRGLLGHPAIKQWVKFAIDRPAAEKQLTDDGVPMAAVSKAFDQSEPAFESSALSRAFVQGYIKREAFVDRLVSHGVSQDGATRLANRLGLKVTNHPALADFAAGTMDRNKANSEMLAYGMSASVADALLDHADRAVERAFAVKCQVGIKRRYLTGDVDKGDAIKLLVNFGTTGQRASKIADNWECEQSARGKAVAAAKLCEWLGRGAITANDFRRRLVNLGYDEADAGLMVEDCLIAISAKRLKEAEKQAKDEASMRERQVKALQKAARDIEQYNNRLLRMRETAKKTKLNRDKQFFSAVDKLTDKNNGDTLTASQFLGDARRRIERDYALSIDEALQTLLVSVEEWNGEAFETLTDLINNAAAIVRQEAINQGTGEPTPSANTNGATQPSA